MTVVTAVRSDFAVLKTRNMTMVSLIVLRIQTRVWCCYPCGARDMATWTRTQRGRRRDTERIDAGHMQARGHAAIGQQPASIPVCRHPRTAVTVLNAGPRVLIIRLLLERPCILRVRPLLELPCVLNIKLLLAVLLLERAHRLGRTWLRLEHRRRRRHLWGMRRWGSARQKLNGVLRCPRALLMDVKHIQKECKLLRVLHGRE